MNNFANCPGGSFQRYYKKIFHHMHRIPDYCITQALSYKPFSPDTGFHVLTPTEVAAAEEGKDPEQFGFDVGFCDAM